jgi:hypothetical protein
MLITLDENARGIFTNWSSNLTGKLSLICGVSLLFAAGHTSAQTRPSVYTSLAEKQCRKLKSTGDDYLGRCPGIGGYSLLVAEGDLRQNILVVTPKGTRHSLELWSVVSPAFSSVGPKAEWRVITENRKTAPTALIVRYNASEDPEKPDKKTSYLVVTKITANEICVTDKVSPGPTANEEARRLADAATNKPCLKPRN